MDSAIEYTIQAANYFFLSAIGISFLSGLVLVILILKRKPSLKRELWTKYFYYLVIVSVCSLVLISEWRFWWCVLLLLVGLVELIITYKRTTPANFFAYGFLLYVLCALGCLITAKELGTYLFIMYALVVLFDGFSQLSGLLFGRHKLAPRLSPAKTLEGFAGGFLAVFIPLAIRSTSGLVETLFIAMLFSSAALAGDLLASKWKRKAGVKDFSHLIPAHGGILDRFDSFIGVTGLLGLVYFLVEFL